MKQLLTLLCLVASHVLMSQDIDKIIQKQGKSLLKHKEFKAISIGVYKDGQTFINHFGTLQGSGKPTDETIYEIASVSKTFTGYLVAKAITEGKLKLEDHLSDLLGEEYSNLSFEGQPITVEHVITHTAGLPHFMLPGMAETFETLEPDVPSEYRVLETEATKERFFDALIAFEPSQAPGTNYKYSNAGAELMGYLLSKAYGLAFDQLLSRELTAKLGLNDTGIRLSTDQESRLAVGYWMKNIEPSPPQLNPLWASGSGIKATLPDLMKWIDFNLNSEELALKESHRILYEKKTRWVSYFWNAWKDKNGTSFNHHGGTSGTQNYIFLFPKYNLGISIITNHSGPKTPRKLMKSVQAIVKQLDYKAK
ncbi:serine hydrolase [Roseivirga sp. E12]|uniref:serine hydrolase domain-containing protein n=1 Tax=Roseivirga sp. E12 TaxID=2819237 RepID=UPI001ABD2E27|nr:serine hydrolase domain-containing protein [Roseivirga sp. E12]MBO3697519.1 beta-lactamase family protein [Roseivirga sp. E12]